MNERRDAIKKMGGAVLGGAAAIGGLATRGPNAAESLAREHALKQQAALQGLNTPVSAYGNWSEATQTINKDPLWDARWKAAAPLREKLEKLQRGERWQLRHNMNTDDSSYLPALRSTARWWRASVQMDRAKKRQTAIESLQQQANELLEAPMDKIESMVNEMLATFMAEFNR